MDIETRIIYINGGILLASGRKYVLEEKEILPVKISSQETENGFKLIATVEDKEVQRFSFYINNELYKTDEVNRSYKTLTFSSKPQTESLLLLTQTCYNHGNEELY